MASPPPLEARVLAKQQRGIENQSLCFFHSKFKILATDSSSLFGLWSFQQVLCLHMSSWCSRCTRLTIHALHPAFCLPTTCQDVQSLVLSHGVNAIDCIVAHELAAGPAEAPKLIGSKSAGWLPSIRPLSGVAASLENSLAIWVPICCHQKNL